MLFVKLNTLSKSNVSSKSSMIQNNNINNNNDMSKIISLDPGLRTFMTGLSDNKVIKIGDNSMAKLRNIFKKIDKIKYSDTISLTNKKKHEKKYNKKLKNAIDELHWKTINYLTNNYERILIGNMSSKQIVKNNKSNLSKMMKRIALKYKFYEFRTRLHYKCNSKNVKYKCVNESYTSKVCSNCGYFDSDLGGKKIYNCEKCEKK